MEFTAKSDCLSASRLRFLLLLEFTVRSVIRLAGILPGYTGDMFSSGLAEGYEYLLYSGEFLFVFLLYFYIGTRKFAGFTLAAGCLSALVSVGVVLAEQQVFFQFHDFSNYQPLEIGIMATIFVSFAIACQAFMIGHCCSRYGWFKRRIS